MPPQLTRCSGRIDTTGGAASPGTGHAGLTKIVGLPVAPDAATDHTVGPQTE